jgi:hypothetical protein
MNKVIVRVKLCRALLCCSLLLLLLSSCSAPVAPSRTATPSGEEALPPQDYIIGSEDSVEVQV